MAGKIQKNPFASQDKYLISEQPGMAVLVSGLLIALFVGLLTRAVLSPHRVKALIEKAAQSIHKDVQVQFQDAEVSLSDGILPRFAVVVSNVVMSSEQECWMRPQLSVDQIQLPISFLGLLTGRGSLHQIQAGVVKVHLRGEYKDCRQKNQGETANKTATPPRLVSLQDKPALAAPTATAANRISSVTIDSLQVVADSYPDYQIDLHDIGFQVKQDGPRWLLLNAKTYLFRNGSIGDYFSHANIHIEYKESPETLIQAHFFGNWREGHYSLVGNYSFADHNMVLETELKHIPFSQILSLMQRYRLADPALNAKQLWLSFRSRMSGDISRISTLPVEISNLLVDGDQIEIDADKIVFRSIQPLIYDPIELNVQSLGVDKILTFFNRSLPTKIFANVGSFSGKATIHSGKDIRLIGRHNGLQFIFSNKGQRELQTINKMRTEAAFKNEQWHIQLSEVEPDQGAFAGQIQLQANKTFSDMNLKLKVDQAIFAPAVQTLMTQGGGVGPISSQIDLSIKERRVSDLKGFLKVTDAKVEGVEMAATQIRLNYLKNEIHLDAKMSDLKVSPTSYSMGIIKPIFESAPRLSDGTLQISNIAGQFLIEDLKKFRWKNVTGSLLKNARVQTDGSWDEGGRLEGTVQLKTESLQKWKIGGTRATPEFMPGHESIRK